MGYSPLSQGYPPEAKRFRGTYSNIFWSAFLLTVPMALLAAVLLALVFKYQLQPSNASYGNLHSNGTQDAPGFVYININTAYLLGVASLMSSLGGYLSAFAISLAAYPLASATLKHTKKAEQERLLTPYQFYLAIDLLQGGGIRSLWSWLQYRLDSRRPKGSQPPSLGGLVASATAMLFLYGALFVSDTWFHFSTQSVAFEQVQSPTDQSVAGRASFILPANCTITDNSYDSQVERPCSIIPSSKGGYLINPSIDLEVLNNMSSDTSVNLYHGQKSINAFLGTPGNGALTSLDFMATTFSMTTQCAVVTTQCGLTRASLLSVVSIPFACPQYPALQGNVAAPNPNITYFKDGTAKDVVDFGPWSNPFYFGVSGSTLPEGGSSLPINNDPNVVSAEYGGVYYILFCNGTIYDTTYTATSGSIGSFDISVSNSSVANMILQALVETTAAGLLLENSLNLGGLTNTSQQLADTFSTAYSQALLALVAGVMDRRPALEAQQRSQIIAARISVAALFTLTGTITLLFFFGMCLAVAALVSGYGERVEDVRARLSLSNLVASYFEPGTAREPAESMDEMFPEKKGQAAKRIGVGGNADGRGGWSFVVWPAPQPKA